MIEVLSKVHGVVKQYKDRRVVLIDNNKYTEKCMLLLNIKQFKWLDNDPVKAAESKIHTMLKKTKARLSKRKYKDQYPSGLSPGKFYGRAKVHKASKKNQEPFQMVSFNYPNHFKWYHLMLNHYLLVYIKNDNRHIEYTLTMNS